MFLRYLDAAPQGEALVLRNANNWRVELLVLYNNDDSCSLVALSGNNGAGADKVKLQGPYQHRDVALAARSAVAAQLLESGFTIDEDALSQWRVMAQRYIKELRTRRALHTPDCSFDPKDVL